MINLAQSDLRDLEDKVHHAVVTGDESALHIIGFGEITTVLMLETAEGRFALKRLPVMKSRAAAEHVTSTIDAYAAALTEKGVHIVPNEARTIERGAESFIVYCVQVALDESELATNRFKHQSAEECHRDFVRIVDTLEKAIGPEVTPDGQLSNWAFVGDELVYLDLSTPFMRDAKGDSVLDWKNFMSPIPAPLRGYYLREVPKILDKYFTLRGAMLDLLGNLRKENLDHLTPDFMRYVNQRFAFEKSLTEDEIRRYYIKDAKMYALIERLRKMDRWIQTTIFRRTYPYLLAPNVPRNL